MKIKINLTPKQTLAWDLLTDDVTTELGYGGAARGGKSWLGCEYLNFMCFAYPKLRVAIGRRELKNLKRTTLLTLFKVFAHHGLKQDVHFNYNEQKSVISYNNGSEIYLLDLAYQPSDPLYTWLGGFEPDIAWIDESNEVPEQAVQILKSRIGSTLRTDGRQLKPVLLETFNPNKGHVYKRFYKPFKEGKLPIHRQFISALPTDNPHIPKSYIEELKRADKITRERLLYGNFEYDDDPAKLFEYNTILDLFTNTAKTDDRKFMTVDVARFGNDKTVIGLWQGLKCYKLILKSKQSTSDTASLIKQLAAEHQIPFSKVVIDEDGVGGGVVDQLDNVNGFMNGSKPILPTNEWGEDIKVNYANLKTQCYFEFARVASLGQVQIITDDESVKTMIIEELEQIKQADIDSDGKLKLISKDKMKEGLGRSPDIADCLMMRFYFEFFKPVNYSAMLYV